jgi:hypothetical protein
MLRMVAPTEEASGSANMSNVASSEETSLYNRKKSKSARFNPPTW